MDYIGETHKEGGIVLQFRRENGVDRLVVRDDSFTSFLIVPMSLIEKAREDEWGADSAGIPLRADDRRAS